MVGVVVVDVDADVGIPDVGVVVVIVVDDDAADYVDNDGVNSNIYVGADVVVDDVVYVGVDCDDIMIVDVHVDV